MSIENEILGGTPGAFNNSLLPFVADVARSVIGNGSVWPPSRVSLATFSSAATVQFSFNEHYTAEEVRAAVLSTPFTGGITLTSNGIELVENSMVTAANGITALSNSGELEIQRVVVGVRGH